MTRYTIWILIILLIAGSAWYFFSRGNELGDFLATATYSCSDQKTLTASYYEGEATMQNDSSIPSVPGGTVVLVLDDGRSLVLPQTLSASGIRYANENELIIFWNVGNTAFLMESGTKIYSDCVSVEEDSDGPTKFKAVILGSGGPIYNSERNGPSILISNGEDNILVDMGNGTQEGLDSIDTNIKSLSGLFLTHHHLDHNEELIPIFIKSLVSGSKFTVTGPPGTQNFVSTNENLYAEDLAYRLEKTKRTTENVKGNYEVKDLEGGESFSHAGMKISTIKVNHTIYTVAYRFDVDGKSIVVSGDLTYSSSLPTLAENADVLIIDSGSVVKVGEDSENNQRKKGGQAHASLDEIGRMAGDANVKTIVLTHFSSDETDEKATKEAIAENYSGEIIFSYDFMEIYP